MYHGAGECDIIIVDHTCARHNVFNAVGYVLKRIDI